MHWDKKDERLEEVLTIKGLNLLSEGNTWLADTSWGCLANVASLVHQEGRHGGTLVLLHVRHRL